MTSRAHRGNVTGSGNNVEIPRNPLNQLQPYQQVCMGVGTVCGLRTPTSSQGGVADCWDMRNRSGFLTSPTERFEQLACGQSFTVGLTSNGTVVCWGTQAACGAPAGRRFQQISAYARICGITDTYQTLCWSPFSPELSLPLNPYSDFANAEVMQICSGRFVDCAVRTDYSIFCYGDPAVSYTHLTLPTNREV